jgi:hypothetical protein
MKGLVLAIGLLILLAVAGMALAQQEPQTGGGGPQPKLPEGMGGAGAYGQLLGLLGQKSRGTAPVDSTNTVYPMFQLFGPDMRANFWADPEAAGNTLILQGELMVRMGEILIKNGRALLDKAAEKHQGK